MAMIKVSIKLSNCKSEGFSSNSNVHIDYSKSKVKFRGSECDQDFREPVRPPRMSVTNVENDADHTSEVVSAPPRKKNSPSVQNKVKQCGGNACPDCHKCMDWSYKGDLHDDYKRLQRGQKGRIDGEKTEILNENRWRRRHNATCTYSCGYIHCYSYNHTYHSAFCHFPCNPYGHSEHGPYCHFPCSPACYFFSICECAQLNNKK